MGQGVDVELRSAWVDALRSGKYEQSRFRLRGPDGFCCLGVVCDLADPSGWRDGPHSGYMDFGEGCNAVKPPPELCERLGLDGNLTSILMGMNDDAGATFDDIADFLQKEWELRS